MEFVTTEFKMLEIIMITVNKYMENKELTITEEKIMDMLDEYDYIFEEWIEENEK